MLDATLMTGLALPCRYEMGRVPAMTKLSSNNAIRVLRVRGGNKKFRALRLDTGNFSWGSEVRYCGMLLCPCLWGQPPVIFVLRHKCSQVWPATNRY